MRKLVSVLTAAVLVLVGVVTWQGFGGIATGQGKAEPAAQKWEYKIVDGRPTADGLNSLGAEGWELVSHTTGVNGSNTIVAHWYILKRVKK
jgi:hypothetical protein